MPDTDYDPSGDSNFLFHSDPDILNLFILYDYFIFFRLLQYMLRFDKATYVSLLIKFISSKRLHNSP